MNKHATNDPPFARKMHPIGLGDNWHGSYVAAANPHFDFDQELRHSLDREPCHVEDLFSLSPLTSPESTPPPSPQTKSTDLPYFSNPPTMHVAGPTVPSSNPPLPSKPKERKARKKARSRASRQKKRDAARDTARFNYTVRENVRTKYITPAIAVKCQTETEDLDAASTGWVGLDDGSRFQQRCPLEDFVGPHSQFNFKLVPWDGRTAVPIIDTKQRIIGILAGHPNDSNWPSVHEQAARALEERRARCFTPRSRRVHRRGRFIALQTGVSHGGGQTRPGNLQNHRLNEYVLEELNSMVAFKRIAGFSSAVMACWAPKLYEYYVDKLGKLHANDPTLKPAFSNSIFSAASYNFGPRTVCFKHKDFGNLPFGWCSVTALGSFDHKTGGHLVLWDCHLVVEFPAGSTILLPSAVIAHSNVDIGENEKRYSFAHYSAGGLFRWVDNKFKKAVDYYKSLSAKEKVLFEADNDSRWELGLTLLPILKTEAVK